MTLKQVAPVRGHVGVLPGGAVGGSGFDWELPLNGTSVTVEGEKNPSQIQMVGPVNLFATTQDQPTLMTPWEILAIATNGFVYLAAHEEQTETPEAEAIFQLILGGTIVFQQAERAKLTKASEAKHWFTNLAFYEALNQPITVMRGRTLEMRMLYRFTTCKGNVEQSQAGIANQLEWNGAVLKQILGQGALRYATHPLTGHRQL